MAPRLSDPVLTRWERAPEHVALEPGSLHVWRAALDATGERVLESLSPDERARAERFSHQRRGLLWARSRGVLRALLAAYLDVDAGEIELSRDERGKPIVASSCADSALAFNLSHSGGLALYAFAETDVGVDVQVPRRRPADYVALAARAFGATTARRLERLSAHQREREFMRLWAAYEARLKCRGLGILSSRVASDEETPEDELWSAELDLGREAAGAVASAAAPRELRCFSWRA
jgi:4'-phosphopantetheinyl transferase